VLDLSTEKYPSKYFLAVSFTVAAMNQPVIAQVCCHRFSLITQTQICYSTCNISAAMQVGPFQVHFIISRQTFAEDTFTSLANGVTFLCTPN